jgi:nucleoid-associated protein YgaU
VNSERRKAIGLGGLALIGLGGALWLQQHNPPVVPTPTPAPTPVPTPTPAPAPSGRQYQVLGGDTLWAIAAQFYGNGALYPQIYSANAAVIEQAAIDHGFASSEAGHWIFPGEMLTIP